MLKSVAEILVGLIYALTSTILIEWGLSNFYLHSKDDRRLVILVQCLTNPPLNMLLIINSYYNFFNLTYLIVILEIFVVIIEGYIYKKGLQEKNIQPFKLSFLLNAVALLIGLTITFLLEIIK